MISIIIVTRNRPEKLKRCLESIKAGVAAPHEVVVIDNSSANMGSSAGRNNGASQADPSSRYLLFLDDDAWIKNLPIQKMTEYLDTRTDIGILAPQILNPDGSRQQSLRSFPTLTALVWRATFLHRIFPHMAWYSRYVDPLRLDTSDGNPDQQNTLSTSNIDWAISACILVSRKAFLEIGGFDEAFFFMHEDTDLCLRLAKRGYKRMYWPDATIYHEYARTSRNIFSAAFLHHIRGAVRILWRLRSWNRDRARHEMLEAKRPRL